MDGLHALELRRLALQAELDAGKTARARNRLGQFATPPALARDVVATALDWLPAGAPVRFLDPAFGTGAFLTALLETAPAGRLVALRGFEADPHYGEPARRLWAGGALDLTLSDFTRAPPPAPDHRPSLIVCNPPYVRHHHIPSADKPRLQALGEAATGTRLSGLAGLYAHFMLLAEAWAAPGAVAAWLVPSEFMDVNYGAGLRDYLSRRVTLLRLHRFDPADVQFGDALVSSAALWWRHEPPPPGHAALFTRGGAIPAPRVSEPVALTDLAAESKWTRFPARPVAPAAGGVTLGDLFTIRRGLATGDNGFFILTPERAAALDLPSECLRPILPSPRHLPAGLVEIESRSDGSPRLERRLLLLDCPWPESEVAGRSPALARYLEVGAETAARGYLCRHRSPWYAQERRPPAPLLCTYMGRGETPFRFIRNRSAAVAPNVYLLLYPRSGVADDAESLDRLWRGLNRLGGAGMIAEGRVYGGGLHKLEPRELARLPVAELDP